MKTHCEDCGAALPAMAWVMCVLTSALFVRAARPTCTAFVRIVEVNWYVVRDERRQ